MLYCTSMLIINRIKKHDIILCKHFHRELNTVKCVSCARAFSSHRARSISLYEHLYRENIVNFKHSRRRIREHDIVTCKHLRLMALKLVSARAIFLNPDCALKPASILVIFAALKCARRAR